MSAPNRLLGLIGGLFFLGACSQSAPASAPLPAPIPSITLFSAPTIHTMDEDQPTAQAFAVGADGRIVAIGALEKLRADFPQAQVMPLEGAITPGLIDAHGHLLGLGQFLRSANLIGAQSLAEALQRLQNAAADLPAGAWLIGRGWDQNDWPGGRFPSAADLDALFPDRPVYLERVDGHAAWVNSAAMALATQSLDGDWQPDGGQIQRRRGKATGILIDSAANLVAGAIPPLTLEDRKAYYAEAFAHLLALGVTGAHDMGVSAADLDALSAMAETSDIPLRVYAFADGDGEALDRLCARGHVDHPGGRLEMRGVKLYADGALGSRGAALFEDYSDDPGNRGLFVTDPMELKRIMTRAAECGVQVGAHAIGDRGARVVLDGMVAALTAFPQADHRWRMEHAQVLAAEDIARFAELGVIASVQPTHATSDMPWAPTRLGPERLRGAYAWRSLLNAGARLALGSDFPVEAANPLAGVYAAETRSDATGRPPGGWRPEEALSRQEALRGFTTDAAFAGFAEGELGALRVGARADFVVWPADPAAIAPKALLSLAPMAVYVDGSLAWPSETAASQAK